MCVSAGCVRPPHQDVAEVAGQSAAAAEETGGRSQTAVHQQTGQTAAGQRRDQRGETRGILNRLTCTGTSRVGISEDNWEAELTQ